MFKNASRIKSKIDARKDIIIFDLEKFTNDDVTFIKNNLPKIYDGRTTLLDLKSSAKHLFDLLSSWDVKKKHGAIAEFLLICLLNNHGYSQEYCFHNLEERSLKKGFDGLYICNENEMWLSESKSSYSKLNHSQNLKEGYNQINDNIKGKLKSNAWLNAYNHSRVVNSNYSLQKKLAKLSTDWVNGIYTKIEDYNLILNSAIYVDNFDTVKRDNNSVETWIKNHNPRQELVIIMTTKTIDIVIDLFKEIINE